MTPEQWGRDRDESGVCRACGALSEMWCDLVVHDSVDRTHPTGALTVTTRWLHHRKTHAIDVVCDRCGWEWLIVTEPLTHNSNLTHLIINHRQACGRKCDATEGALKLWGLDDSLVVTCQLPFGHQGLHVSRSGHKWIVRMAVRCAARLAVREGGARNPGVKSCELDEGHAGPHLWNLWEI